ncbi:response regulator [Caulobacter segnis]
MAELLRGLAVLIVEDEFYLADDLALAVSHAGASVLRPFGRIEEARRAVESGEAMDLAILDIDLMGDKVFPVADLLRKRGAPFLFTTGYGPETIPGAVPRRAQT